MQGPFDIAADLVTPVSAFRKLAPFQPVFLLESVEGGARLARYSLIGLGRAGTFTLDGATASTNGADHPAGALPDVLHHLRSACRAAPRLLPAVPGLGLDGGLVGVIGYDFARRIERLPAHAAATSSAPEIALVAPRSMLVFDHLTRRVALLHAGAEWERQALRREVIAALRGPMPEPSPRRGHEPPTASLSQDQFTANVHRAKQHIRAGDIFQLVLSIRFEGQCLTEPFEVYRALRMLNPSPYMYFFDFGGTQVVGSSPEALVKLTGNVATLRPIAGTRPRGADDAADLAHERDLLADPKEAAEHVMLVDLARNDLGRVARPGSIKVEPFRSIERYSHVMHIVSGVRGELDADRDAFDLFVSAFPAGTVTGAPKVRAMQLIDQLEPVRRGLYAGTVGYFGAGGAMDQAIAIRTISFRDGRYAYQAGAGIVEASDPDAEYREVCAKVGALRSALQLAEEGL